MKSLKSLQYFIFIFHLLNISVKSQVIEKAEIYIENLSQNEIIISIYPASVIFSGYTTTSSQFNYKYSFSRARRDGIPPLWPRYHDSIYINGGQGSLNPNDFKVIDFDDGSYYSINPNKILGGISFGLWKMDLFSLLTSETESYYLDYRDFNIGHYQYPFAMDLYIYLDGIKPDSVKIWFTGAQQTIPISDSRFQNRTIKIWDQVGRIDTATGQQLPPHTPNKGLFSSINELPSYLNYPINATRFGAVNFENPGEIGMNLKITDTVSTSDTLIDTVTNINVTKDAALLIGSNMVFNMITPVSPEGGYNNLVIEGSATGLVLYANAKLNVYSPNWLTL